MTANTLLTISKITQDSAMVLGNSLDLAKRVNREHDSDFGQKTAQIGQTINIRRPIRPTVRTGNAVDIQAITETYSPVSFTVPYGSDYALTSQELTFSVDDFYKTVVEPTVVALASKIEQDGNALISKFYNTVGTPGTALTSGATGTALPAITKALALLNKNDAPKAAGRKTLLNDPDFNAVLAQSNLAYFHPAAEISRTYTDGYQGDYSSFSIFMNQLVASHTNGAYSGSPIVAATVSANSTWAISSTISTSGWGSGVTNLKAGDVFTIAGVYMVNPQSKTALSTLQQFVVSADISDTTGAIALVCAPAVVTTGGFQNVSRAPTINDVITVLGATGVVTQNALAFDKDAIVLVAKELDVGSIGKGSMVKDDQTGIPIRCMQVYDIRSNQEIMRFDVMAAWATLYEQLGVRICTT